MRPDGVLTEIDVIDVLRLPVEDGRLRILDLRDGFVCRVSSERVPTLISTAFANRTPGTLTAIVVARNEPLLTLAELIADHANAAGATNVAVFTDVDTANRWLGTQQWDQLELLRARFSSQAKPLA